MKKKGGANEGGVLTGRFPCKCFLEEKNGTLKQSW